MIRQPVITIVGHVDHGKTSLLDKIRGSAVTATEAGKITQAIGASIIPASSLQKICGHLLEKLKLKLTIPGLLFIDTPGHAAFINLRKRGGALADIAVLVVDINEGFKPQTLESIEILKSDKTPFIVAVNKLDLISGWQTDTTVPLVKNIEQQHERIRQIFEMKLYELVGKFYELGLQADRFDRVSDFTKQLALVPVSAFTGEGIPELLMMLTGLAQRYLEQQLLIVQGAAKGTILEIKEEKGFGTTVDAIIYDGVLRVNDTLVIGGLEKPIVTKVRALLEPEPLTEMRVKKAKFRNVREVSAATGVKIAAPGLDGAVPGMPMRSCEARDAATVSVDIQKEVEAVLVHTDDEGVIIKADALGSLEALIVLLREKGIPIKTASVGKVSKKDVAEVDVAAQKNPFYGVLLGFNVELLPDAVTLIAEKKTKVIIHEVIYHIIEQYEKWKEEKKKAMEIAQLDLLVRGGKFRLLAGYVFRQNNPAVAGVEIIMGRIKSGEPIMTAQGKKLGVLGAIQEDKESVPFAERGAQPAVSMADVTIGRQVKEGDIVYIDVPEDHFRKMKELKHYLNKDDVELLKEIAEIKRKDNPVWGV